MRVESGKVVKKANLPRLADPAVESVGYFHRLAASVRGWRAGAGLPRLSYLACLRPAAGFLATALQKARLLPAGPARTDRAVQYRKVGVSFYYNIDKYIHMKPIYQVLVQRLISICLPKLAFLHIILIQCL